MVQEGNWRLEPDVGARFRSPGVHLQKNRIEDDRWTPGKFPNQGCRAGVMGGVAERGKEGSWMGAQERQQSPFELDSIFRRSPVQEKAFTWSPDSRHIALCLSPPAEVTGATVSASYGSKFWTGQERKRGSGSVATAALDQEADSCEFVSSSQQCFMRGEMVEK